MNPALSFFPFLQYLFRLSESSLYFSIYFSFLFIYLPLYSTVSISFIYIFSMSEISLPHFPSLFHLRLSIFPTFLNLIFAPSRKCIATKLQEQISILFLNSYISCNLPYSFFFYIQIALLFLLGTRGSLVCVRFNEVFVYSKVHRPQMRPDDSSREKAVVQEI